MRAAPCVHLRLHVERDVGGGAECVSAPIETRCTPVSATARTVSSVTPPDASSSARLRKRFASARSSSDRAVVEQQPLGAGRERLLGLRLRLDLDLHAQVRRRRRRAAATAAVTPPAAAMWLSLISTAS